MTPRREIFWIDINKSKEEILKEVHQTRFSKFPVCNGSLDNVLGVVTVKDFLTLSDTDPLFNLTSILREVVFIPSSMPALKVLDLFRKRRIHFGFILDEFGAVEGLVTLHDLVENIMGNMPEFEEDVVSFVRREDGSYLADADMRIDEIRSLVGIKHFPGDQSYSTLAGFVVFQLERIPKVGDHLMYDNFIFEVIDMDGNRIDKVLIYPLDMKEKR